MKWTNGLFFVLMTVVNCIIVMPGNVSSDPLLICSYMRPLSTMKQSMRQVPCLVNSQRQSSLCVCAVCSTKSASGERERHGGDVTEYPRALESPAVNGSERRLDWLQNPLPNRPR